MMNKQILYTANSLCMLVVCSILMGAFYFQYVLGEHPCPLCLLHARRGALLTLPLRGPALPALSRGVASAIAIDVVSATKPGGRRR